MESTIQIFFIESESVDRFWNLNHSRNSLQYLPISYRWISANIGPMKANTRKNLSTYVYLVLS